MNLYLAEIQATESAYMGNSETRQFHRLVWAANPQEAEEKVRAKIERDDPYGTSVCVDYVDVTEAIS